MYSNSSSGGSTANVGIASRVRNRHSAALMQGAKAATPGPGNSRDEKSSSQYPPIRRSSIPTKRSETPTGNSTTITNSGSPPPTVAKKGDNKLKGMLTQLPEIAGEKGKRDSNPKSSSMDAQLAAWLKQPKNLSPAAGLRLPAMLPPPIPSKRNKVLLCLDIDETLVHASFTPAKPYNVKITIDVDGDRGDIFVAYRPHVKEFLAQVSQWFEIAIFTASQSCYANPLMDALDPESLLGRNRMFRQHCTEVNGARVKDMSLLGRSLDRVCLLDNSPVAYLFQPRNAIPILSWFDDPNDIELLKLLPLLEELAHSDSVYDVLDPFNCTRSNN